MTKRVHVLAFTLTSVAMIAQRATAAPATHPTTSPVMITIDTSDAPEMAAFGEKVRRIAVEQYPKIVAALPSDGFTPPMQIRIVFRKDYRGVAECGNDSIKASVRYFTDHPDDTGAFVHELVHVVQHYTRGDHPNWLVEGIADYVRFFQYEPESKRPHPDPKKAKATDSYRTTAAFLDWAQRTYDAKLVEKLNAACRAGEYREELWKTFTGKTLNELGTLWKASLNGRK